VNQIWCDVWHGSAHCGEGYVVTLPSLITDGEPYLNDNSGILKQAIVASGYTRNDGNYLDQYAMQGCIRHLNPGNWMVDEGVYDCRALCTSTCTLSLSGRRLVIAGMLSIIACRMRSMQGLWRRTALRRVGPQSATRESARSVEAGVILRSKLSSDEVNELCGYA
jgi:hypothetical protein